MLAENSIVFDHYADNTGLLVASGLCFKMPEANLEVCFQEDNDIVVDLLVPELRDQGFWERSYLPQLEEGPWVLAGFSRFLFLGLPPSLTINQERVGSEEDAHSLITHIAYLLPWGALSLYSSEEPKFVDLIRKEVSYRDFPPLIHANYVSLIGSQFGSAELNERHAVRPVVVDDKGCVKLQGMAETRTRIRGAMGHHLTEIHRLGEELQKAHPAFSDNEPLNGILSQITDMKEALVANRLEEVVRGIKKLRSLMMYAQMRNVVFPGNDADDYPNREVLEVLMRSYSDLAAHIRGALNNFVDAERGVEGAFEMGVAHYRNVLRYLHEDQWDRLASGKGPWEAIRQMRLAAALHLAQDSVAHCVHWDEKESNICQEYVSVNLFGLGTLHTTENDRIKTEEGEWKETNQRAVSLSYRIRELSHMTEEYLAFHGQSFDQVKNEFLGHYWPEAPR
ncbi:MAG: hypothetical protein HYS22_02800 [Deltaproteobacteria bacterium]|nr:hypothetical protein [Deltaproteobacteria bacterium]